MSPSLWMDEYHPNVMDRVTEQPSFTNYYLRTDEKIGLQVGKTWFPYFLSIGL